MGRTRSVSVGAAMAACVLFCVTSPAVSAPLNGGLAGGNEWPMYHGGFTHAGASQAVGPSSPAASWTLSGRGLYADNGTSPVVGLDGTVYLLQKSTDSHTTRLEAISPTTHKALWWWTTKGAAFRSTPTGRARRRRLRRNRRQPVRSLCHQAERDQPEEWYHAVDAEWPEP